MTMMILFRRNLDVTWCGCIRYNIHSESSGKSEAPNPQAYISMFSLLGQFRFFPVRYSFFLLHFPFSPLSIPPPLPTFPTLRFPLSSHQKGRSLHPRGRRGRWYIGPCSHLIKFCKILDKMQCCESMHQIWSFYPKLFRRYRGGRKFKSWSRDPDHVSNPYRQFMHQIWSLNLQPFRRYRGGPKI